MMSCTGPFMSWSICGTLPSVVLVSATRRSLWPKSRARPNSKTNSTDKSEGNPKPKQGARDRPFADYLCFAIYSANLAYGRAYKQGLAELGLTYPQWIAIVVLSEEGEQTVGELGDRMFLESNTLTPML